MIGDLSLYFHIPFCKKKCPYCHFFVIANAKSHEKAYMEALKKEWDLKLPLIQGRKIRSIYLGGGTPTELSTPSLLALLNWVKKDCSLDPSIEITIESNPENITKELIEALVQMGGVNRLSLGVQSLEEDSLLQIGRAHTPSVAKEALFIARENGIENLTIDLLYDLPGQTLSHLEKTLDQLASLPITHLSLYNLVIEPGTAFERQKKKILPLIPKEEISILMLDLAVQKLEALGLKRYEISAFAKPGFEAVHNMRYWKGSSFFGYGPSAFSYEEGRRFQNVCDLKRYIALLEEGGIPIDFEEKLPYPQNIKERIAIALRPLEGVDLAPYFPLPADLSSSIENLTKEGFLQKKENHIALTPNGLKFYDTVATEII